MSVWSETIQIDAPVEFVFNTISTPEVFMEAVPQITAVEFLSETRTGVGTRFKETRLMKKREASTELEITEQEENALIRMVSEAGGTTWDSIFTTEELEGKTHLTLVMTATPHNFLSRLTVKLIKKMLQKTLKKDMEAIKSYCENAVKAGV